MKKIGYTSAAYSIISLFAVFSFLFSPLLAVAEELVDQEQLQISGWLWQSDYHDTGQTFTVGTTGYLTGIEIPNIFLNQGSDQTFCRDKLSLKVFSFSTNENGLVVDLLTEVTNIDTLPFNTSGSITFDTLEARIKVVSGDIIAFALDQLHPDCHFLWAQYYSAPWTGPDAYPDGRAFMGVPTVYRNGYDVVFDDNRDMTFRTYVTPFSINHLLEQLLSDIKDYQFSPSEEKRLMAKLENTSVLSSNDKMSARALREKILLFIRQIEKKSIPPEDKDLFTEQALKILEQLAE